MAKSARLKPSKGAAWPAQNVEMRPLAGIKPYEHNTRKHDPDQVAQLAALMKKYGVDQPIVVDEKGIILKGHGRRLGAYAAGFEVFPVVVHHGLSDVDKKALRIADNQSALLSGWDDELMKTELKSIEDSGFDLNLLGFDNSELENWGLGDPDQDKSDPDSVPEPVVNPVVRQGDIWLLGDHRLLCGDSTLKENWDKLLNPVERASVIFTDPPYGVSYEGGNFEVISGDDKRRDDLYKMLLQSLKAMTACAKEDAAFYIWHASTTRQDFSEAMTAAGLVERQYLIWVKPQIVLGHADYSWQHEPFFYAAKADRTPAFYGDRKQSTVWHVQVGGGQKDVAATVGSGVLLLDGKGGTLYIQSKAPKAKKFRQLRITEKHSVFLSGSDRQDGTVWEVSRDTQHIHPTQKPVELVRRAIENSSRPGEIVIDGFLGSSSTIIGAETTARKCYGMEIDPAYAQLGIERWQRFTGKKAVNATTNKTLEQTPA